MDFTSAEKLLFALGKVFKTVIPPICLDRKLFSVSTPCDWLLNHKCVNNLDSSGIWEISLM